MAKKDTNIHEEQCASTDMELLRRQVSRLESRVDEGFKEAKENRNHTPMLLPSAPEPQPIELPEITFPDDYAKSNDVRELAKAVTTQNTSVEKLATGMSSVKEAFGKMSDYEPARLIKEASEASARQMLKDMSDKFDTAVLKASLGGVNFLLCILSRIHIQDRRLHGIRASSHRFLLHQAYQMHLLYLLGSGR